MAGVMIAVALLLALQTAGAPAEPRPGAPGALYRALGTEPFWSVAIGRGQMRFETPNNRSFAVPTPAVRNNANGYTFRTRRLTVEVTRMPCSDGMSDRRYADTVAVIADGRAFRGCGGAVMSEAGADLAGSRWTIASIGGTAVGGPTYRVEFTADRISGMAGCNRFSARYTLADDTLALGATVTTRMACSPGAMANEGCALSILSGPVRVSRPDASSLVLRGQGGEIRLRPAS